MDLVFLLRTYFSWFHSRAWVVPVITHSILRLCLASLCFSLKSRPDSWIGFFNVFWIQWIWRCQGLLIWSMLAPIKWPFLSLLMWLFLVMHASIVVQCLLMILEFYGITWQRTGFTMPDWLILRNYFRYLTGVTLSANTHQFILAVESVPCTLVLSTTSFYLLWICTLYLPTAFPVFDFTILPLPSVGIYFYSRLSPKPGWLFMPGLFFYIVHRWTLGAELPLSLPVVIRNP
jgi:hypothetical protein